MMTKPKTVSVMLIGLVGTLNAADPRSPDQILDGKAAASMSRFGRHYDGQGAYSGRSSSTDSNIRLYDGRGGFAGRVQTSKNSTRL